jgi:hypothetical protein
LWGAGPQSGRDYLYPQEELLGEDDPRTQDVLNPVVLEKERKTLWGNLKTLEDSLAALTEKEKRVKKYLLSYHRITFYILYHTSHITFHVTYHTSHSTQHISSQSTHHISHHIFHITYVMEYFILHIPFRL